MHGVAQVGMSGEFTSGCAAAPDLQVDCRTEGCPSMSAAAPGRPGGHGRAPASRRSGSANPSRPCIAPVDTVDVRILDGVTASIVLGHPRHQAAQSSLAALIQELRECTNVEDGHALQQTVLEYVLAVEAHRNAFSQAVKRFGDGKGPQRGAPDPQSGLDPALPETWKLERDVCERIGRQYRCVGDALAWRVFGFERRQIIALCQNAPPGVWAGKKGV